MKNHNDEKWRQYMKKEAQRKKVHTDYKKTKDQLDDLREEHNALSRHPLVRLVINVKKAGALLKKIVRKLRTPLTGRSFNRLQNENRKLKTEAGKYRRRLRVTEDQLKESEEALEKLRTEVRLLKEETDQAGSEELLQLVKTAYEKGEIFESLDRLTNLKSRKNSSYNEAFLAAAKKAAGEIEELKLAVYEKILNGLKPDEVPEFLLRGMEDRNTASLEPLSSFRGQLTTRLRRRQLGEILPEWELDDKQAAYKFAENHGFTIPAVNETVWTAASLPKEKGTVIKPVNGAGARGVYLIVNDDHILDVKRSEVLTNVSELDENMAEDLHLNWVSSDQWKTEELFYNDQTYSEPARDLKFYCFYGKAALILEVKRFPEPAYCWWTPEGKPVRTGKYEKALMKGNGFSQADLAEVEEFSLKIPAPFCRIDFLSSDKGLVFGEITPKPGNYDHFNKQTDQLLGEYYLQAEGRLMSDLLNGKPFPEFRNNTGHDRS
ncbi:teichuronopeptide biosynthesis [Salipaludibacillus sp. CUR1]|uniref:ATP-grasp fold amidoligase family protein n=1 Tax=Salipaludibacillus sp. CUR1 TaxID=2820003 RepID=UPI001E58FD47|nr:teichuronopeptide biosynthesis [Salipaludibacillus sp. CUR1]